MADVKVSANTITAIQKAITGDNLENQDKSVAPYQTGGKITSFFEDVPGVDISAVSLGTRWVYVEEVLKLTNGSDALEQVIEAAVNPLRFVDSELKVEDAVSYLNRFLAYDGYVLNRAGRFFKLRPVASDIKVGGSPRVIDELSHASLVEQLDKCETRLSSEDYDGAITAARLVVEGTLKALDAALPGEQADAKGDLPKLYKGVSRKLKLDPELHDTESLKSMLRGLTTLVHGLATLRNSTGDAHPRRFKPSRHHAQLAINAAKTITDFLIESHHFQSTVPKKGGGG